MTGTFDLYLSKFRFVEGHSGRMLRFTKTWLFTREDGKQLGESTGGCLVSRQIATGELAFSNPTISWSRKAKPGGAQRHQMTIPTPDFSAEIVAVIQASKYAPMIGKNMPDLKMPVDAEMEAEVIEVKETV